MGKEKEDEIAALFDVMDTDKNGSLSAEELSEALRNDIVVAQFAQLGVAVPKVDVLFHSLDADGNCLVTKDEFVQGLAKLHGSASANDIANISIQEEKMNQK